MKFHSVHGSKMRSTPWNSCEVTAAVDAYFSIFAAQQAGSQFNKSAKYKELSGRYPERSPKAFERKLQNISAILYEQNLPYCYGLKPCNNYQKLLKSSVLLHLEKHPITTLKPYEILESMLKHVKSSGALKIRRQGSGRYGLAIEEALGIAQNSDKAADFMGIELKTKSIAGLQTLFSRTPTTYGEYSSKFEMFESNCYFDNKKGRKALYTSFNCVGDSLGFKLVVNDDSVKIFRSNSLIMTFSHQRLEEALLTKHNQTAFIGLRKISINDQEHCEIQEVRYCENPDFKHFLHLLEIGDIYLDMTMSMDENSRIRDHGFLWRVRSDAIEQMYRSTTLLSV